ncbi:MAG TPA: EVE domain-containing protein [Herpetosiphonaceae bacterium]|nr:EVE domain-containing protein [Herpetosiphonaceae bacterium]
MPNTQATNSVQNFRRLPRAWIFQANPDKYKIETSLRVERDEMWNLRQHHKDVNVYDHVLIWIAGHKAGIYAVGTVTGSPVVTPDTPKGIGYWNDKRDGYRAIARVPVRYNRVLIDRPVLRDFLLCDPDLWDLSIFRNPRGTNFAVTEAEWKALKVWLDD